MANWFKRTFSKKKEDEPLSVASTRPSSTSSGTTSASSKNERSRRSNTSSGAPGAPRPFTGAPPPRQATQSRPMSSHDLSMAAATLGVHGSPVASQRHSPNTARQELQRQQAEADLAAAYSVAAQQAQQAQGGDSSGFAPPLQPLAPYYPGMPPGITPSPFGEAISLPPPPAGQRPDLAMAAALAESQFSARQADELAKTTEALYQQAVTKAMEASMATATYDDLLRDIKLWIIDLAAATDDVLAALDFIVKKRDEVAMKLERALVEGDEKRQRKLEWQAEQLPIAEIKLRELADKMMPIGVAVVELEDLREHIGAASPSLALAERLRDEIIARLFGAMEEAGLRMPERSADDEDAGPSSSNPAAGSAPAAPAVLRDLIAALIHDAQRLPRMPRRNTSSDDAITPATASPAANTDTAISGAAAVVPALPSAAPPTPDVQSFRDPIEHPASSSMVEADLMILSDKEAYNSSIHAGNGGTMPPNPVTGPAAPALVALGGGVISHREAQKDFEKLSIQDGDNKTLMSDEEKRRKKKEALGRRLSQRTPSTAGSGGPSRESPGSIPSPGSGGSGTPNSRRSAFTTPIPFQLSSSRWNAKGPAGAPVQADVLRRVPALISLHYELRKDSGVVAQAVQWTDRPAYKPEIGAAVEVPEPQRATIGSFESPEAMVTFVRENGGFPSIVPSKYDASDRWSVMCAAAGVHEALSTAVYELNHWKVAPGTNASTECHRVVDYVARVGPLVGAVTHPHDPLRHAVAKHHLAWNEKLANEVRWAAQNAAVVAITSSLESSEEAERVKGAWQRQAVLKPLGHGIMAGFAVHQFAGGFSTEAAAACDQLVERTVHYARLIDPKWFRGHKVVS